MDQSPATPRLPPCRRDRVRVGDDLRICRGGAEGEGERQVVDGELPQRRRKDHRDSRRRVGRGYAGG
jgi:hypothetical protein